MSEIVGSGDAQVWTTLARWRIERRRFVLVTVIDSRGFTPRKAGAHMLVSSEGLTVGTIGGGAIEHEVIAEARRLIDAGGTVVMRRHLTRELGMCCGGEMAIFLERIVPATRMFVLGAGHIARPLAAIAAGCGYEVTVVDARSEWTAAERFPAARVIEQAPEDYLRGVALAEDDVVVVATHDHALDQRLIEDLLPRRLGFLGMIGSVPKRTKFELRLRARGFDAEAIARLRSPLGVNIGATGPEEIAVSVMAEIIAARRGVTPGTPWRGEREKASAHETGADVPASRETSAVESTPGEGR